MRVYEILLAAAVMLCGVFVCPRLDAREPVAIVFDTDIGDDIDDVLALAVIHALESRGECRLLAVTVSKDYPWSAPFVDAINTFYGRGEIPIGAVRDGKLKDESRYARKLLELRDGDQPRYPRRLANGHDAPEAVALMRKVLAGQPDGSVTLVSVGPLTNVARLLESKGDESSSLDGKSLVAAKCGLLSTMAGMFSATGRKKEWNVYQDLPAARTVFSQWPTQIVASGYEIGESIQYPAQSIERDFSYVQHHPVRESYELWGKMPFDRPAWDLTSVLYAVRPDRGYFGLSPPGTISVDDGAVTQFAEKPDGRHRYLTVDRDQISRTREALVQLASQPP